MALDVGEWQATNKAIKAYERARQVVIKRLYLLSPSSPTLPSGGQEKQDSHYVPGSSDTLSLDQLSVAGFIRPRSA